MEASPVLPLLFRAPSSFALDVPESSPVAFNSAFIPSRGDLIFGLSSAVQAYERYPSWTPSRILESLLVAMNIVAERPEAYTFVGMTANLDKNGARLQKALFDALDEARSIRIPVRTKEATLVFRPEAHVMSAEVRRVSKQHLCGKPRSDAVAPLLTKFDAHTKSFDQAVRDIFGGASNNFTRHTLDTLFEHFERRPDRSPAWSLMQAADAMVNKKDNVVANFGKLIFARMSKSLIDAFVSQPDNGPIQSRGKNNDECARIHFFLDDMDMGEVVGKYGRGESAISAKELRYLYRIHDRIGDAVKFYRHGNQVAAPWVDEAALWDTYQPANHFQP